MDEAKGGVREDAHFDPLVGEGLVKRAIAWKSDGGSILGFAGAPASTERCLGGGGCGEVLGIEVRVAEDADGAGDLGESFTRDLEEAGPEIARNAVVGDGAVESLVEHGTVEALAATGMALEHHGLLG